MSQDVAQRYVERMGSALTDVGMVRLPSRVFAALTIDDDGRMTAAELAEALGVSAASISGAVGLLTRINFIHRERERGSRRDVFVVDDDAWHQAMLAEGSSYGPMIQAIEDAVAGLPAGSDAWRRLSIMREFLLFVTEEHRGIAERWVVRHREVVQELSRRS